MSATMTVWEAKIFEEFLNDKKSSIDEKVHSPMVKEIVNLVFAILQKELKYETEEADREFSLDKDL